MADKVHFRISSALKDLIGNELITDEYIAVFELVKNSYDAYAKKVSVIFEDIYGSRPRLLIIDDGKGMNKGDLKNKWLFVAYSAKTEGKEDIDYDNIKNYRDKIHTHRVFAGAKGIGRFSCDRLGKSLQLLSIKDEKKANLECLSVDWENFEEDAEEEFIEIGVLHKSVSKFNCKLKSGTILAIRELRDNWDRKRLLALKHSLEKLINPNQDITTDKFKIEIVVPDEEKFDNEIEDDRQKINGYIKNFVFETLEIKTTNVTVQIVNKGKYIVTSLTDRGRLIYKIKEENPYRLKSNITLSLFYLNRSAKNNFAREMGIPSVQYGSVFVYKNGFRIYPYGEEGEDFFGLDRRKAQGYARYFGTRDLIGRIEINDHKDTDKLKETTSRDGGLIKNDSYYDLEKFFYDKGLDRLEKYVVDVIKWGDPLIDKKTKELIRAALNPDDVKPEIVSLVSNLAKSDSLLEINTDKNFLKIIEESQRESLATSLVNLERIGEKAKDPGLLKELKKAKKNFDEIIQAKKEIEKEADQLREEKGSVEKELKEVRSQNLFLQSISTRDFDQIVSFVHQIGIYSNTIDIYLKRLSKKIRTGQKISNEELLNAFEKIDYENKKILTFANFTTKANYKHQEQVVEEDIASFIVDYLNEIKDKYEFKIKISLLGKVPFIFQFKPIEIILIIDTLLSNSKKHKTKSCSISLSVSRNELKIVYNDDGKGLNKNITNPEDIFEKGFTTTNGSGMGLYYTKQIIKRLNGSISVTADRPKGIEFQIRIKK